MTTTGPWLHFDDDPDWDRDMQSPHEHLAGTITEVPHETLPRYVPFAYVAGTVSFVVAIAYGFYSGSSQLLSAIFIAPLLLMILSPFARRLAKADDDPHVASIIMAACVVKLAGAIVRFQTLDLFYGGQGDSTSYHNWGKRLAPHYRQLDFDYYQAQFAGTQFIRRLTGWIYALIGPSMASGFLIYSFIAFIGMLFLWRAFKVGVPEGDTHRYAAILLFYPSLLYWPSAIGKDAWMLMGIGIASWGVARLLMHARVRGIVGIAGGIAAILCVRPHIGILVVVGLLLSFVAKRPGEKSPFGVGGTVVMVVVIVIVGGIVIQSTSNFLGVTTITTETVDDSIDDAGDRTRGGDSEFDPVVVNTPADFPYALVTVLLRPFPWEAGSALAILSSVEGLILGGFIVRNWRSLIRAWSALRKNPYIAYCLGYILAFVYAFSAFSNFGILARQRVQVLPFFLALLALISKSERDERKAGTLKDRNRELERVGIDSFDPYQY